MSMLDNQARYLLCYFISHVMTFHPSQPRKRRRQLYFARKTAKKTVGLGGEEKKKRKKPTRDQGVWTEALPEPRTKTFIKDKLKVVEYYLKLQEEEQKAKEILAEPVNIAAPEEVKAAQQAAQRKARALLKQNKEEKCRKAFPTILQKAYAWKWAKTAKREGWFDLPVQMQGTLVTTPNIWRKKIGLKPRAREIGKTQMVPDILQKELDHLILEHARGNSDVSERREVITASIVATCLHSAQLTWTWSGTGPTEFLYNTVPYFVF